MINILDIVVLGNDSLVTGFKIAGIKRGYPATKENIDKIFEEVMNDKTIGIVIMDNKDFEYLSSRNKERSMTQVKPTVVVLSHDTSGEENMRMMIKRAIGVDLWGKE